MGFLITLFGRREKSSSSVAKDRLLEVLIHDRIKLPPATLEQIRLEILAVLSKYIEVDRDHMEVSITRADGSAHLTANIPIRRETVNMHEPDDAETEGAGSIKATSAAAHSGAGATAQSFGPQPRKK